jgi:hypothetical protein
MKVDGVYGAASCLQGFEGGSQNCMSEGGRQGMGDNGDDVL